MEKQNKQEWENDYCSCNSLKDNERKDFNNQDIPKKQYLYEDKEEVKDDTSLSLKWKIAIFLLCLAFGGLICLILYWLLGLAEKYFGSLIAMILSFVVAGVGLIAYIWMYLREKNKKKNAKNLDLNLCMQDYVKKEKEHTRETTSNYTKELENEMEKEEQKESRFILCFDKKDDGHWYVEDSAFPFYEGDLRIGADASELCEHLSKDGKTVGVGVSANPKYFREVKGWCRLERVNSSIDGAKYRVVNVKGFTGSIWLGTLTTRLFFGEYPETIYFVNAY